MVVTEGIPRRQPGREAGARTYARSLPIVPVRARGLTIEGADGRRYLDCLSGAGTLALGHNHPVVLEAVRKVLDSGAPLHVLDVVTPVEDAFVTELVRTLPPGLARHARVQFCGPAGRDAVAAALRLVRTATGRPGILAFTGARHGTAPADAGRTVPEADVTRLPYPQDYRCPFGVGGPRGAELAARWTESLLDDPLSGLPEPAGLIVEAVQGPGGVVPAPDTWLRRIRQITADRSLPLVADEIRTGVGRTGAFWAVQHSGVTPDVMVMSKAIGGSLPLSVVVHRDDLDPGPSDATTGHVRGNQLAMAAGTATLAYVREHRLPERAAALGARILSRLHGIAAEIPCVGDVRGRGLMIGLELVQPEGGSRGGARGTGEEDPTGPKGRTGDGDGTGPPEPAGAPAPPPPAPGLAAAVQRECLRRGLIVGVGGRHGGVVRLLPPLTITDEQAAAVVDRLADALEAVARKPGDGTGPAGPAGPVVPAGRTPVPRTPAPRPTAQESP
ncbi:aminotransferase class III-fold pyridoxal phosphate-dependent enzyme [Streptomyces sp. MUM 136J]|uniref:aminotransferase class III-fold pyridoxal phosphate-dependent enzyme n=1 Tax=Streptomyces sp. MUM 136J TaxID=2791992 RepID=UPI001F03DA2B|nr:aminotransferase class III-fold pyridoxal phosphate-dependent enzyme [Streptomyces sp. MUM 136J]MCH0568790.1 aminotransferase class III-fold pyridoxal phosphate-dependent enzyme [Streptomyces sp. MUM 136J]